MAGVLSLERLPLSLEARRLSLEARRLSLEGLPLSLEVGGRVPGAASPVPVGSPPAPDHGPPIVFGQDSRCRISAPAVIENNVARGAPLQRAMILRTVPGRS